MLAEQLSNSLQLRDTLSWLSAVVPACLRECRNIDGNSATKGSYSREGERRRNMLTSQTLIAHIWF